MPVTIDYYMTLNSPWTYLGAALFSEIAARNGASVNIKPAKFGPIFEQSGGFPLPKSAPRRRTHRYRGLERQREGRVSPPTAQPRHFHRADAAGTRRRYRA